MGKPRTEKEHEILESVVREELEFIIYVDVPSRVSRLIIWNGEKGNMVPPPTGRYDEQVNDGTIAKFIHPEDQKYCREHLSIENIQKELEEKNRLVVPFRLRCENGYRMKEISIFYHDGDKDSLVLVRRDVEEGYELERKNRERLYQALTQAQRANEAKNEFLEHMSHELRTPINSIIGLSYLIGESESESDEVLENLDKINLSARFLISFVNDILDLSQIESGKVALMEEDIDFDAFLECIKQNTAKKAEEKKLTFAMEKRGEFYREYRFDAEKLQKALLNLLDNAVKFTPEGGRVELIVEGLPDKDGKALVRFNVSDTGLGIEPDFLPYIFEPFEQEVSGGTVLSNGAGIGLAVSRNIIEYMQGHIEAHSERGQGSVFVATVPLQMVENATEDISRQEKAERMDYDFTGKRALLVEDNEINIEITRNILKRKNLMVEVAVNGEEGVASYMSHEPGYYDVILMDIRMPVMDGLTAAKKIRSSERADSLRVPIIAMTANVFEEDVRKSFEAGMDAHLSKPMDIRQMYFVLDSMIFG